MLFKALPEAKVVDPKVPEKKRVKTKVQWRVEGAEEFCFALGKPAMTDFFAPEIIKSERHI